MNLNNTELSIWGRQLSIPVEYEFYDEEVISDFQKELLKQFVAQPERISNSKSLVESYCKEDVEGDSDNLKKNNIFSYLKPDYIFVKRSNKNPAIALMCKYRYDPEHGIAIVFYENDRIKIGSQDIIL